MRVFRTPPAVLRRLLPIATPAAVVALAAVQPAAAQAPGLVAAYGFNETSGTTTADASGNNNTGTLGTGVTRTTTGKFGGALAFNGTSGRVTVANAPSLQLTTAMTLEAWVNPTLVNSAWRDVIYKSNDNYYLMGTTDHSSRPAGGGIIGDGWIEAFGTAALAVNTWTHIAVTYDGANVRFYANGTLVGTSAKTGTIATSTNPLTIGGDAIYGQYFQGAIDEVRVYNRALSAAEVQTDMNTPVGVTGPDTQNPAVTITTPTTAATYATKNATVTLSGSASDNIGVTQVSWTNDRGGSGTATGTTSWSTPAIALQPGANVLTVTSHDAAGNVGTTMLTVTSDPTLPTVAITTPSGTGAYTATSSPIAIGGTASDNIGVASVSWSNDRGGSGTATGTTAWTVASVALQPGSNVLTVTASDAVGNVATSTLTVTYNVPDTQKPTIAITTPTSAATYGTKNATVTVGGTSSDNVGVTQVTWSNNRGGSGTATGTTSWSATAIALQPGSNVLTVTSHDAAGNTIDAVLTVTSDPTLPTVAITAPSGTGAYTATATPIAVSGTASDNIGVTTVAWSNDRGGSGTASGTTSWSVASVALQPGTNVLTVSASDAVGNAATATLTVTYNVPDNTAPTIAITSPTAGGSYTTNGASVTVGGTASDNVGVTQVSWTNDRGGSGTATGTTTWSAASIALQPGVNVITVTARDAANNGTPATLTVTQDVTVPSVTLTAPAAGATVSGSSTALTASATDNLAMGGVTFLLDGTALGSEVGGAGPSYGFTWNTVGVANGTHVLSARARDGAGNTAVSPGVSVTVSNTQPSGLVAAFGFEETTGSSAADASGNNNAGSIGAGVTHTASGKFGGALVFNGSSGKVTVANSASLGLTGAMTLEAWVNPSVVNSAWRDVIYKANDNYYLMATTTNSSRPAGGGTFNGGPATTEAFGTAPLATNTWTHLATTYDGASVRLYVNGVQVSSTARTGPISGSSNPLTLGGDAIYGQYFKGTMDEVRVYNRALSVAEIQTDMVTPVGGGAPVDATAPTIAITSPTGAGTYTAPASPLSIGGTASDNVGVTQVTWTNDRGGAGTATGTTSWSVGGIALQPGTNVLTVTARDAANNSAPATLTVTYNAPDVTSPTVTITAPTSGASYSTNSASVALGGSAADNVGVTQVSWANSTNGTNGTASGTTSWSVGSIALQSGNNVITVTARDAANNVGSATLTVIRDATVPTVALTAPAPGATLSGANNTITVSASDNIGIAGVQLLLDGANLGAELVGAGPTFNYTWNTLGVPNGPHTLSARARDAAGNTSLAPNVAVTVTNTQAAGLVAAYGFEELEGDSVADISGNNNTARIPNGISHTASGKLGAGLVFTGTAMVSVPSSASLALSTGMTIEAWVKPAGANFSWADIVYKGNDNYYLMGSSTNGSRPAGGGTFGGGGTTEAYGTAALTVNNWTHLATSYDGATLRFFVNGTQVSSVAKTGAIATSNRPLQIGGDSIYGQFFQGTIDEVRIYNRALTVAEIQNDMVTPVTDPAPPPLASDVGQWSAPFDWPLIGLHAALLKTGEVISWEYNGAGGPFLWNPTTNAFTSVPESTNKFCAGQAALPDGRFLIAGGDAGTHVGITNLNIFDPVTRSWTAAPPMAIGRWYPTVTGLPDGRQLITSGEINCDGCVALIPEVYNPLTNTVSKLNNASANFPYYPHMYVLPDGRVLAAATAEAPIVSKVLDVATQTWSVVDPVAVDGGSSVMYLPGKILKTGTSHNPDLPPDPSAATAYLLDMTQPSPHWQLTTPMSFPRTYHNLTVMPDGTVLATGGGVTTNAIDPAGAVYAAELWSPVTQKWTTLSSMAVPRLYHSIAILLPDGRVLIEAGGRFNGYPSNDPSDRLSAEIFSPPYLFKGARPTISSAPSSATAGSTISVQTPNAAEIASVSLIRLASVTHAFNTDQRYLPLTFTPNAGGLDVQMPANSNLAPPGYYMLFILNANGVPSVASIIQVQ